MRARAMVHLGYPFIDNRKSSKEKSYVTFFVTTRDNLLYAAGCL